MKKCGHSQIVVFGRRAVGEALCGQLRHDQGVAARIRLRRISELDSFLDEAKGARVREPVRLLALDSVTNPQNIGMIVRSVVATGFDGLLYGLGWDQPG